MKECRLQYQKETGHQVEPILLAVEQIKTHPGKLVYENGLKFPGSRSYTIFPEKYVEWLEDTLEEAITMIQEIEKANEEEQEK